MHKRQAGNQTPRIRCVLTKASQPPTLNRYVLAAPITWTADHKDTTEPHE